MSYGKYNNTSESPAERWVIVTPGPGVLSSGQPKALLCSEDGNLNLTPVGGTEVENIPVQKGYNPLRPIVIDAPTSGSAPSVVIALY